MSLQQYIIEIPGYGSLDTYGNLDASFTYNFEDLTELSSKSSKYSKTITLPDTPNNNEYFQHFYELAITDSYDANKRVRCNVRIGDNNIFPGYLKLEKSINLFGNIEYEVNILSIEKNLFEEIGDTVLPELPISKYNHTRSKEIITGSWDSIIYENGEPVPFELGKGYVYPRIIYGNSTDITDNWYTYDAFPAIYVKTIIDSIAEKYRYKFKSEFFNSEYFKRLIIPYNKSKVEIKEEDVEERKVLVGVDNGDSPFNIGGILNTDDGLWTTTQTVELNDESTLDFKDDLNQWDGLQFTCAKQGIYNITFNGKFAFQYISETGNDLKWDDTEAMRIIYDMSVFRTNGGIQLIADSGRTPDNPYGQIFINPSDSVFHSSPWFDTAGAHNMDLVASNVYLEPGDVIRVRFKSKQGNNINWDVQGLGSNKVNARPMLYRSIGGNLTTFKVELAENILMDNEEVDFYQLLPNMKVNEFFKGLVDMFNLSIVSDPNEEDTLIIEPIDTYLKSKKTILEWDDLLDRDDNIEITPTSTITSQKYKYSYKLDSDYFNKDYNESTYKTYGDLEITTTNEFNIKTEEITLPFASTPNATYLGLPNTVLPWFVDISETTEITPKSVLPRILFYGGLIEGDTFNLKTGTNDSSPFTSNLYPYAGHWDHPTNPKWDLSFDSPEKIYWNSDIYPTKTLYSQFHRNHLESIISSNGRLLKANFYLTPDIIASIDPRDIIQIDNTNWRILSINDYNPIAYDRTTEVELIKIVDFETYEQTFLPIPTGYSACPADIIRIKGQYYSPSGQPITENCCKSLGGLYRNGACYVLTTPTDVIDFTYPRKPIKGDGPIKVNNGNTIVSDVLIRGNNNITSNKTKNSIILGDNNNISNQSPSSIVGDNNTIQGNDVYVFGNDNFVPSTISSSFIAGNNNTFLDDPNTPLENIVILGVNNVYETSSNFAYLPSNLNLSGSNPTINDIPLNVLASASLGLPGVLSIDNKTGGNNINITNGDKIIADDAGTIIIEAADSGTGEISTITQTPQGITLLTDDGSGNLGAVSSTPTQTGIGNFDSSGSISTLNTTINNAFITVLDSTSAGLTLDVFPAGLDVRDENNISKFYIYNVKNSSLLSTQNSSIVDVDSTNSSIIAGVNHTIDNDSNYSVILGGLNNTIDNNADSSAIIASEQSTIDGASFSAIIGGQVNEIGTGVIGSVILGGTNITATEDDTVYQNDSYRVTNHTVTTTNNTPTNIWTITPNNGVYTVEANVTGFEVATGNAIGAKVFATFKIIAGVVTIVGVQSLDRKSDFSAGVTCELNTDGTIIRLQVTGDTGLTITWKSSITITK